MILKKLNQSGISHYLVPLVVAIIIALIGVKVLSGSHADQLSSSSGTAYASCSVSGIPSTIADGYSVSPEVIVANSSSSSFTTTVNGTLGVIGSGINHGGGFSKTVTVPANGHVAINTGITWSVRGAQVQVTASSTSPSFSCNQTAGHVVDSSLFTTGSAPVELGPGQSMSFKGLGAFADTPDTECFILYIPTKEPAPTNIEIASARNTKSFSMVENVYPSQQQVCVGGGSVNSNAGFSVKNTSAPISGSTGPVVDVYSDTVTD